MSIFQNINSNARGFVDPIPNTTLSRISVICSQRNIVTTFWKNVAFAADGRCERTDDVKERNTSLSTLN